MKNINYIIGDRMRALANVLWHFPFFGFLSAFLSFLIGTILTITVVAAPIGIGLIQYSKFLLLPFSYEMIKKSDTDLEQNTIWKTYGTILKIIYVPFIGLPLFILTCLQIIALVITILGIPVAIVVAKSLPTLLQPVDKICVPRLVATALAQHKADKQINKYLKQDVK